MAWDPTDISNYWNQYQSNPAQLRAAMQQYNVSPEMIAAATGSGVGDILNRITPPAAPPTSESSNAYQWNQNDPTYSNGNLYTPIYDQNATANGITQASKPIGYTVYKYDPAANDNQTLYNGQPYTTIDNTGKQTGSGKLSGFSNQSFFNEWGPFLMAGAGFTSALAAGAGAAGAAGGAAGEAGGAVGGAGGGAFNAAVDSQAANAAIDAAGGNALGGYTAAGTGGIGAGAGGVAGSAPLETMGGLTPMSSIPTSTFPTVTGGGGSWLSSILPAGMSQYLGPAASILGAIAGSQPVKQTQTSTSAKDPRVAPFLFGDGSGSNPGLLGYTAQQLARDQSPQSVAQVQQMKNVGMGLLSAPVAGNGFAQFTKGRY